MFCANRNHAIPLSEIPDMIMITMMITMSLTFLYNAQQVSDNTNGNHNTFLYCIVLLKLYVSNGKKNISKTCTLSLFTLFRILLSIAPYAQFPSWMLVYYWRSTISIVHWQWELSNFFAIQQRICITHHAVLLASPGSSSVTCQA